MKTQLLILLFLVFSLSIQAQCDSFYVSTQSLNIRESPSKLAKILRKLSFREYVMVDNSTQKDGFLMLKSSDCIDTLGYVWAGYLAKEMPEEIPQQSLIEIPATTRTLQRKTKSSSSRSSNNGGCGPAGVTLNRGPRGGCYYLSGRSKIYVGRNCCN